jgi:hypothetical protein
VSIASLLFSLGIFPLAYTNYVLFDSPFVTGYQRTAVVGKTQDEILLNDHTNKFNQKISKNSIRLLFDQHKGIIPTNIVILLAIIGSITTKKKDIDKRIILIIAICLIQFIIFAKYDEWHTSHFSNRFLMTSIALTSIFTSRYLRNLLLDLKLYQKNPG